MTNARHFVRLVILQFLCVCFLVFYVASKHAHLLRTMLLKVEPVLFAEPQLQKIVVETLLADADLGGSILETVAD